MNKEKEVSNFDFFLVLILLVAVIVGITLICVHISNEYNILSNKELINITNNAYITGALSISRTGIIPYFINNTIETITFQEVCNNLNRQEVNQNG